jgi:hypothetical protein
LYLKGDNRIGVDPLAADVEGHVPEVDAVEILQQGLCSDE